ncbi:MAG: DUF4932 domain-containing protein [Gemmatimonadaceae bacterium]|nr:DUF4932 domain-containing protein [Gemmatimonadaceae bacterium]
MPRATGDSTQSPSSTLLTVDVHPGLELLAIMAYLGQRYPTPLDSKYKSDVWTYFKRFRNHPALDSVRSAPLYPDFTEIGLALGDPTRPSAGLPDSSGWYATHGRGRMTAILKSAARFAKDTRFDAFRRAHAADYVAWSTQVKAALAKSNALATVERFYRDPNGAAPPARVRLYLEPLNNWGAHQIDIGHASGAPADRIVRFQFGPDGASPLPDSPLSFDLDGRGIATVWHEVGHDFIRSLMSEYEQQISALSRLYESTDVNLRRQNVTTWRYAFEENVIRAVVAVVIGTARGQKERDAEVKAQVARGFVFVPALADLLQREYVGHRDTYPTFERFAPRMLEILAKQ